jgi:hypothetical protein
VVAPVAPLVAVDVDSATIIRCQPKLYGVMFWYFDEACHVNHKQVNSAVFKRFTAVVAVDVVFHFTTANGIDVI